MLQILGLDHIVLRTGKIADMLHFYCDILGCTVERDRLQKLGLIQLRAGYALIDLIAVNSELGRKGGQAPSAADNNLDHFCLQLAPISQAALTAYLQQHHIHCEPFGKRYGAMGWGESLYIRDPEGNAVELKPTTSALS